MLTFFFPFASGLLFSYQVNDLKLPFSFCLHLEGMTFGLLTSAARFDDMPFLAAQERLGPAPPPEASNPILTTLTLLASDSHL